MNELAELWGPDDDWRGITRVADRRRRQNRLNQRAYRRRHAQPGQPKLDQSQDGYLFTTCSQTRALTQSFMHAAHLQYTLNAPRLVSLLALIRLNALNALSRNAAALGIPADGLYSDELISPFNSLRSHTKWASCPESLRPTSRQLTIQHHPWTDLLPIPRLRDNILDAIVCGALDEDELCHDLLDVAGGCQRDEALLLVWGDPWDVRSWEVSAGFLSKWGWLLRGCRELVEATNLWRVKRGEKRLNVRFSRGP